MIEDPEPNDWRMLQEGVCRIFNEIGLNAETNRKVTTPRGEVTLDVFGVDPGSIDKIQYVVECKNWKGFIPQSVIHTFTTVMHEVGAHVGYIVSKRGCQKGGLKYLRNTNIKALTFKDFQSRYLEMWIDRYFCKKVSDVSDSLIQYTEPINSRRERYKENLSHKQLKEFSKLYKRYNLFGMILVPISNRALLPELTPRPDLSVKNLNNLIKKTLGPGAKIETPFLRGYLEEFIRLIQKITKEFNDVFGQDIFAQQE